MDKALASFVKSLEVTPQIGCPNDCDYCPQEKFIQAYARRGGERVMKLTDYKRFLERIPRTVRLDFAGFSEPSIHPDFVAMLLTAHQRGFKMTLYTTAIRLTAADIKAIRKIPFVNFTLHLPDDGGYTKIKVDDQYLSTIKQIFKEKISNLEPLCMGYPGKLRLHPRLKEILTDQEIKKLNPISRAGNVGSQKITTIPRIDGPIPICQRFTRNMLFPNGEVALCCMDWGLKHIIGNLKKSDYASLRESAEFKKLLRGLDDDSLDILCRYCEKTYENCRKFYSVFHHAELKGRAWPSK